MRAAVIESNAIWPSRTLLSLAMLAISACIALALSRSSLPAPGFSAFMSATISWGTTARASMA